MNVPINGYDKLQGIHKQLEIIKDITETNTLQIAHVFGKGTQSCIATYWMQ
jgi:hypothetical protein